MNIKIVKIKTITLIILKFNQIQITKKPTNTIILIKITKTPQTILTQIQITIIIIKISQIRKIKIRVLGKSREKGIR